MSPPERPRLLPGVPRVTLALVVFLGAAMTIVLALSDLGPVGGPAAAAPPSPLWLLPGLALHGGLCGLFLWRARSLGQERRVWTQIACAAVVFATAAAVSGVLGVLPATREHAAMPLAWAPVLAFPFAHRGLVRWNRYTTSLADPDDLLNGFAAVLGGMAVLNVVVERVDGALAAAPWWQVQPLLAQAATGVVLAGTAASVISLGAMGRDPRAWLVTAVFTLPFAGDLATVLLDGRSIAWSVVCEPLSAVLLCLAALLRPARTTPQPTDPTATTVGAFFVIVASILLLLVDAGGASSGVATWCAAGAALGSSVRLLVNVRELAQLAITRREALTDELTGLANRRAVLRRVAELDREQIPLAFALLDLDRFKEVNDGLGHAAGDELLRQVAARLQPVLRTGDLLGRLGGDEFAVVAVVEPGLSAADVAASLCTRLHDRLAEPFRIGGMSVHVGASIGGTVCTGAPADGHAPARLLREADAAMYDAKRSGTGSAQYDHARHGDGGSQLALVEELHLALAAGQLVLHHQPQVRVSTREVVGVEALVRWQHPQRGLIGPAEFLATAEAHGLMGALTDQVLAAAVEQLALWRSQGLALRMSVNLSASNLLDAGLPARVAALLEAHAVPAEDLTLEVTETVLLSDTARSRAVVADLRALGVGISIDDFGTGYCSLAYLRELPVTELKLDRSFTADLVSDPRTEAIVGSTLDLAHRLGLRVVAEGVEDERTLARLCALGCDDSQGYLHSVPLPAAELTAWLSRGPSSRSPALR
ncbi:putative bifunctional diguanylate cyclase/phosphodiesterase [Trujillonella endophytica]|uniref:Diguanylate cyclase/phosphodiesterase n=1 Tax=Trujillonella endophytica TaxID=673521 RepID=A0A1H8VR65_9ACTN|nr:bifunctional diguanylate cyclase/phosphodiesterase [Trujillella endophytica]SEP17926.1 diguanylate cyclase/phosphodiesterase [Trujillella endophytica]